MKLSDAKRMAIATVLLCSVAAACTNTSGSQREAPVLDALWPDGRSTSALAELATRAPLAADEDFRAVEIARDGATSHHVVSIRNAEIPHRHDRHDLLVVLLKGHGTMQLGDEQRAIGEGSILYVPRGTPHTFANLSGEPAVAYAVYLPAFDPSDRVLIEP